MKDVYMEDLIVCTKTRRGNGKDSLSPIRIVKEVIERNGDFVAEHDNLSYPIECIRDFIIYRFKGEQQKQVMEWAFSYFVSEEIE